MDCIEHDTIIGNSGAGGREPGSIFQTSSAQVISGRRVGKYYAANRTATAGDKGDLTAAFGAENLLGAGGENLGASDTKRWEKRVGYFINKVTYNQAISLVNFFISVAFPAISMRGASHKFSRP